MGKQLASRTCPKKRPTRRRCPPPTRYPRCDCGLRAVTILTVRVGCDPQYTIRLPLCRDCLALEQELREAAGNVGWSAD